MNRVLISIAACICIAQPVLAEVELSFYTGYQTAPHSKVTGNDPAGAGDFSFTAGWEGRSFEMPPYYGVRVSRWVEDWSYGLDFTHTKVYADDETLGASGTSGGFEVLEFTDGLNNLTFNMVRRWPGQWGSLTPYAGGGVGIVLPHAEVQSSNTVVETEGYQFGGLSATALAGASYEINENWSAFAEYKFSYSAVDVDLDGGGNLETDVITNALNVGLSFNF